MTETTTTLNRQAAFGKLCRLMFTRGSARAIIRKAERGAPYDGGTVKVTYSNRKFTIIERDFSHKVICYNDKHPETLHNLAEDCRSPHDPTTTDTTVNADNPLAANN